MSEIHRRIPKNEKRIRYSFIIILKFVSEINNLSSVCSTVHDLLRAVYLVMNVMDALKFK